MSDTLHIRPKAGLTVRDPITREPLPAEGKVVPKTKHWLRRLTDGDVDLVKPERKKSA